MKNMLKLGLILAAYAVTSCFCLALVNNITAPVIEAHRAEQLAQGLKIVYADADSFEPVTDFEKPEGSISIDGLYAAKKNGSVIGAVTKVSGPTYDRATIIVGQDLQGVITGVQFLELSDSPGFGQKARDPSYKTTTGVTFYDQFIGKKAADGFTVGSTFEAVSGATITSRGVGDILTQATYTAGQYLTQFGGAATGAAPVAKKAATVFTYEDAIADMFPTDTYGEISIEEVADGEDRDVAIPGSTDTMWIEKQYLISANGKVIAAAVSASGQSYHDAATVLTAVDEKRTIIGTRITFLDDTPQLGMRTLEEDFYGQFAGKSADQNLLSGADYEALSGASISSDCVADVVKVSAYEAAQLMSKNGGAQAPAGSENYELNKHYNID
ncbi:MAG: FMN-binding protein [Treponema sp.]|nr:FMN-binding protein [Treponema sp.]